MKKKVKACVKHIGMSIVISAVIYLGALKTTLKRHRK